MITRRVFGLAALAAAAPQVAEAKRQPPPSSTGPERIVVSFATNRDRTGDASMFGSGFGNSDRAAFDTGTVDVAYDPARDRYVPDEGTLRIDVRETESPEGRQPAPRTTSSLRRSSSAIERFIAGDPGNKSLRDAVEDSKLFFVHGYNNTFRDAMAACAKMARTYGIARTACFSWPSYGSLFRYEDDQAHARDSGVALSRVVRQILGASDATATPARTLDLVCHSMGAQVLSSALATLQREKLAALSARRYFGHTILAAANERADALGDRDRLQPCIRLSEGVFVYTNVRDKVLNFSGEVVNHRRELGQLGPDDFEILPGNVYWVDCSNVGDNGLFQTGHGYFLNEDKVVADIRKTIGDDQPTARKRTLR